MKRLEEEGIDTLGEAQAGTVSKNAPLPSWVADIAARPMQSYTSQFTLSTDDPSPVLAIQTPMMPRHLQTLEPKVTAPPRQRIYQASGTRKPRISFSAASTESPRVTIAGFHLTDVTTIASACSSALFHSRREPIWLAQAYGMQRFAASQQYEVPLTLPHEQHARNHFWNIPPEPLFPLTRSVGNYAGNKEYNLL
jgi:hypothetical protein